MKSERTETIRGIIFDLDGTLIDSYLPIMESLNHVRRHYGLGPYRLDEAKRMVGRGLETLIAQAIGEEHVENGVALFREMYRGIFLEKTTLMPGAREIVLSFSRNGYMMTIASNKPSYFTAELLRSHGLRGYFTSVLGPDNVSRPKPYPDMVEMAISDMSLQKNEVIYIGDMTIDIETCRRAGIRIFAVSGGSSTREELEEASPDLLFNSLGEIERYLRGARG